MTTNQKEAISLAEEASYTPAKLIGYEDYWKAVSSERTMQAESYMKGEAKGKAEGKAEATLQIAKEMKEKGVSISLISAMVKQPALLFMGLSYQIAPVFPLVPTSKLLFWVARSC